MSPDRMLEPTDEEIATQQETQRIADIILRTIQEMSSINFYIKHKTINSTLDNTGVLRLTGITAKGTICFKFDNINQAVALYCAGRTLELFS